MIYRIAFVAGLLATLAGCVTASNTLSLDEVSSLRLAAVSVRFTPEAAIW